jgi:ABC-type lipoprotein export system ATPase subunit
VTDTQLLEAKTPELVRVYVTGLLGEFEHTVPFPREAAFVVLHGPNGIGKTHLLQLIVAIFRGDSFALANIPFASARLDFHDGSAIEVLRQPREDVDADAEEVALAWSVSLILFRGDKAVDRWEPQFGAPRMTPPFARHLDQYYPYLDRVGPRTWLDTRSGRRMSLWDIHRAHPELRRFLRFGEPGEPFQEPNGPLAEYIGRLKVHLIETQRLLPASGAATHVREMPSRTPGAATVDHFAQDLTDKLNRALALNSRTSQQLDRSFPRRLLSEDSTAVGLTDEMIRDRYDEQSLLRDNLARISVLDAADDLPLPARALEAWERRVLWYYLEDTEKKLSTFRELLDKVNLLVEVVNARFLRKKLHIDPVRGFDIVTRRGERLSPASLSSGEQHELVLLYDLLFNVQRGTLVLIDEPEISLHVAWQQQFLNDLNRIATLTSVRFVVATHSPQIVNKWWSHAVALADDEAVEKA